ncbi:FAD-binding oxidoreductase [Neptuniibacter sp. QD72_48]|uniref:FAD-binding oxidoreductase n=1 Tax=unclassified Neptuniibacter TaxID=2630693 RepID=UPI0039F49193
MLSNNRVELSLVEKRYLTPRSIELTYKGEGPIRYIPGQFFSIEFTYQGQTKARSYSVANGDLPSVDNRLLTFVITLVPDGAASEYFRAAELGSTVAVNGPFGNLILPKVSPKRFVFIATGAGVTPFRSMLPELRSRISENPELKMVVIQGVRNRGELLYADEFFELTQFTAHAKFIACFSREESEALSENEASGYVSDLYVDLNANPDQDIVYLCGHPDMIDQAVSYFDQHGFNPANLKREKYQFSLL